MSIQIKQITAEDLRGMEGQEGLILQGCGGDLQEWVDGINQELTEAGILLNDAKLDNVYVYGRTYKPTVLSKRPVKNNGERPMVIIHDALPRVFDPEMFQRIQTEMAKREAKRPISETAKTPFGRYSGKYALSDILICDQCGALYRRVVLRPRGKMTVVWKCGSHQDRAANCPDSPTIKEIDLQTAIMGAIRREYLTPGDNEETMLTAIQDVLTPVVPKMRVSCEATWPS